MNKIIIGTTNRNKIKRIKALLANYDLEIIPLDKIKTPIIDPDESASRGLTIAAQKALGYIDQIESGQFVLTQDDTIVFDGVSDEDNPGAHIKEPVIKQYGKFTDENAIEYYSKLAEKYGGSIGMTFHYGHALARIRAGDRDVLELYASTSKLVTRIVSTPYKIKTPGYFFSCLMQVQLNGEWTDYNALSKKQLVDSDFDLTISITNILKQAKLIKA